MHRTGGESKRQECVFSVISSVGCCDLLSVSVATLLVAVTVAPHDSVDAVVVYACTATLFQLKRCFGFSYNVDSSDIGEFVSVFLRILLVVLLDGTYGNMCQLIWLTNWKSMDYCGTQFKNNELYKIQCLFWFIFKFDAPTVNSVFLNVT